MTDAVLGSGAAVTYTDVVLRVQFYNVGSTTASPAFSSAAGSVEVIDLGARSLGSGAYYTLTNLTLPTPVLLNSGTNVGVVLNWQGNTGSGLVSTDNLTTAVRVNPPAVGSTPGSYFRNASGETDFNFLSSDSRNIGANSAIAIRLNIVNAAVPELPSGLALMLALPAVFGVIRWSRRSNKAGHASRP